MESLGIRSCNDEEQIRCHTNSSNPTQSTNGKIAMKSGEERSDLQNDTVQSEAVEEDTKDRFCRTCLEPIETDSFTSLKTTEPDAYQITMLTLCLPQVNLGLTTDPVICQKCFEKLENFYNFLSSCLNTERKLVDYSSAHSISQINLKDLLAYKSNGRAELVTVKTENYGDTKQVDINSNSDSLEVKEELEEDIKLEPDPLDKKRRRLKKCLPKRMRTKSGKVKEVFSKDLLNSPIKCEMCNREFNSKWAMDRHTPSHNTDRMFICQTCNMEFRYKNSFEKHLLVHLNNAPDSKPFSCDICGKFFNRKSKMKRHRQVHVFKEKPFGCKICGKRFTNEELMASHIHRVHDTEKAFSCELCGNKYSSKSGLDAHLKSHFPGNKPKPEPDLMCDFCGKLFFRKYALEKHRMSHTGEKPFECEVCSMGFKERYHLTIHMRRHTGERPFDCEICGFKFASKNRLGVHMRIHTGVRPFPCQMCEMAFTRKDHLIKHMRAIHTGERPFVCDICNKTFNRSDYLFKHKKVHIKRSM